MNAWLHDAGLYEGNYDRSIYVEGDFSESVKAGKELKEIVKKWYNPMQYIKGKIYWVLSMNCMHAVLDVFSRGKIKNYSSMESFNFRWFIKDYAEKFITPNWAHDFLERHFGNKAYTKEENQNQKE